MKKIHALVIFAALTLAAAWILFLTAAKFINNQPPSKVEVISRLLKDIPTYKTVPPGPIRLTADPKDGSLGLPEELKEEIALELRVPVSEIYDDFMESHIKYGANFDDLSISIKSAPVALGGESIDGILVWIEAPNMCGSGGCWTTLYHRQGKMWNQVGELFGCARFEVLNSQTHGLRDIKMSECNRTSDSFIIKFNGEIYN